MLEFWVFFCFCILGGLVLKLWFFLFWYGYLFVRGVGNSRVVWVVGFIVWLRVREIVGFNVLV